MQQGVFTQKRRQFIGGFILKKKIITVLLIMGMGLLVLTACGDGDTDNNDNAEGNGDATGQVPEATEEIDPDDYEDDDVLVRINDEEVLFSEFEEEFERNKLAASQQYGIDLDSEEGAVMIPQIQQQAIESLISQNVMLQEAENQGIDVSDEDVEENIANLTEQFGGEEGLEEAMEAEGLDDESLRAFLRDNLMIENLFSQNLNLNDIEVTGEEKEAYYAQLEESWEEQGQERVPFEEVEEQITQQLQQQKQQEMQMEYLEELTEDSEIERLYL